MRKFLFTACLFACLAAGPVRADALSRQKIAVLPFEGIDIPSEVLRAATALSFSTAREMGADVVDGSRDAGAPTFAPPTSNPSVTPFGTIVRSPALSPSTVLVIAAPVSTPGEKAEVAKRLGGTAYLDGKLARLGHVVRLSVSLRDLSGAVLGTANATAQTDDELAAAIDTVTRAVFGDAAARVAVGEREGERSSTKAPPRVPAFLGVVIGGMIGVADTMDRGMLAGFDGRFERGRFLAVVNVGIGIAGPDKYDRQQGDSTVYECDDDVADGAIDYECSRDGYALEEVPGMQLWTDVDLAAYLSDTMIAPYLGAGFGLFVGGRVHSSERLNLDADEGDPNPGDDATKYWDSVVGLDLHPTFGVEFLKRKELRLHLEVRYTFNISMGRELGHGPIVLAGVNF